MVFHFLWDVPFNENALTRRNGSGLWARPIYGAVWVTFEFKTFNRRGYSLLSHQTE